MGDGGGGRQAMMMFGAPRISPLTPPALSPLPSPLFSSPQSFSSPPPPSLSSGASPDLLMDPAWTTSYPAPAGPRSPLPSSWRSQLAQSPSQGDIAGGTLCPSTRDDDMRAQAVAGGGAVARGFNGGFDERDVVADAPFGVDWDCCDDESCEAMEEACRNGERVSMFREYRSRSTPRWRGIDTAAPEPSYSAGNPDDEDNCKVPTLDEPADEVTMWAALAALQDRSQEDIAAEEVHEDVKRAVQEMDAIVDADFGVGRP
jgi:hypothetical protein